VLLFAANRGLRVFVAFAVPVPLDPVPEFELP
jgi:hypothetical protein